MTNQVRSNGSESPESSSVTSQTEQMSRLLNTNNVDQQLHELHEIDQALHDHIVISVLNDNTQLRLRVKQLEAEVGMSDLKRKKTSEILTIERPPGLAADSRCPAYIEWYCQRLSARLRRAGWIWKCG